MFFSVEILIITLKGIYLNYFFLFKDRKRTSFDLQNPTCPLCGLALRQSELAAHLAFELEKLENNQIANKVFIIFKNIKNFYDVLFSFSN